MSNGITFLFLTKRLYKSVCPSIGWSVRRYVMLLLLGVMYAVYTVLFFLFEDFYVSLTVAVFFSTAFYLVSFFLSFFSSFCLFFVPQYSRYSCKVPKVSANTPLGQLATSPRHRLPTVRLTSLFIKCTH